MHREGPVPVRLSTTQLAILFLAAIASGCGDTRVAEVAVAPTGVRCQTTLSTPPTPLPADGASVKAVVTAARECSWSVSSEASWIQVAPSSGEGESEVTLTAAANDRASSRSGVVLVNDQRVTIAQEAAPCRFALERSQTRIGAGGGRVSVAVIAPGDCAWTASSSDSWARVPNASRTGPGEAQIEVQAHTGDQRTAKLTIAGEVFTLTQERFTQPSPGPAPPTAPSPAPAPPAPAPAPIPPPAPPRPTPTPTPPPAPVPDPKGPTTPPQPPGDRDDDDDDDDDGDDRGGRDRKDKDKDKDKNPRGR
jgi:hypothetical protein